MAIKLFYLSILLFSSLLAENRSIKYVTFDVINYKKVHLKLLHLKESSKKSNGLKNKKSVTPYNGLILEFSENEPARIWMKDMDIPIDIIFISKYGEILSLVENATPCINESTCTIYTSKNAKYVIETNSGFIIKNYINYVDRVDIIDVNKKN